MQASASRDERSASSPLWKRKPDRRAVVIEHTHDRRVGGNRRGRGRWKAFLPSCFADITPSYHQTTLPRARPGVRKHGLACVFLVGSDGFEPPTPAL